MDSRPTRDLPVAALLALYFVCSASYAYCCGLLGSSVGPLAAYQGYVLTSVASLALSLILGRSTGLWAWRRAWPPSRAAWLTAAASVIILTASTLGLLLRSSLVNVVASKAGRLLLVTKPSPPSAMILPGLGIVAVVLAAWNKPISAAALPLLLAACYVGGYWLKLRAVREAGGGMVGHGRGDQPSGPVLVAQPRQLSKGEMQRVTEAVKALRGGSVMLQPAHQPVDDFQLVQPVERPADFLAAEQLAVALLALATASLMAHHTAPAPLGNWKLWLLGASSLGAGLFGTRIMLRAEPASLTFPAYSMASLLASLCASAARGELQWSRECAPSIAAAVLAGVVVFCSSGGLAWLRRRGRRLRLGLALVQLSVASFPVSSRSMAR